MNETVVFVIPLNPFFVLYVDCGMLKSGWYENKDDRFFVL